MPMLTTFLIRLPVWPVQAPLAHPVGKLGHLVEHGMDLGHHVDAVDDDRLSLREPEGHVQDGPILGDVDLVAPEHGLGALPQARLLGKLEEEPERFVGDPVLGIVEEQPCGLDREPLAATGVVGESRVSGRRASSDSDPVGPSMRDVRAAVWC